MIAAEYGIAMTKKISQPIPKTNKHWKELRMIQRH